MTERVSWYDSGYRTHYMRDLILDQRPNDAEGKLMVYDKFQLLWGIHIKSNPKFMEDYFEYAALAFFVEGWCDATGLYAQELKERQERAEAWARKLVLDKRHSMKQSRTVMNRSRTYKVGDTGYFIFVFPWRVPVPVNRGSINRYPFTLGESLPDMTYEVKDMFYNTWMHESRFNDPYLESVNCSGPYETQNEAVKHALDHMVEMAVLTDQQATGFYTGL